jgi:hypothetical protein
MFRLWIMIIIFYLIQCTSISATKYYVSRTTGDDSRDGKSVGTAWKTISKVNGKTFLPGDSILFNKGDVWRETLIVPSSGNARSYIVFSSYGTGAKPRILGSIQAISWTNVSGNIWSSATSLDDPYSSSTGDIYFISLSGTATFGVPRTYTSSFGNLVAEYNWTWNGNKVYVYSPADPGSRYGAVEAAQREFSVNLNFKEYIEINGIDMFYDQWGGVTEKDNTFNYKGFILRNCESAFHGYRNGYGYGIYVCYNDMLIEFNTFHDCGRRGISVVNYGSSNISNVIIQNNTFYNGYHTTGPDIETGSNSAAGNLDNIIVRNNLIYDDPNRSYISNSVFVQGPHGGSGQVTGFYFYNNIVIFPLGNGLSMENIHEGYIYNNTFYGSNYNNNLNYQMFFDLGCTNQVVKNNIFYTLLANDINGNGAGLVETGLQGIDADYNLYFRINNNLRVIYANGIPYHMNDQALIISSLGWETHGVFADPLFVSSSDYHLQKDSPAVGKGITVTVGKGANAKILDRDYDGKYFNNPPSIGAYEGNPLQTPDTSSKKQLIILYPNPSHEYLTILREGADLEALNLKIINMSGKIMLEDVIEDGVKNKQFLLGLNSGLYIVQLFSSYSTSVARKLIIVK